ncbi:hypothetical protein ACFL35_14515 [Candidatus Riflebacteria bacterium]
MRINIFLLSFFIFIVKDFQCPVCGQETEDGKNKSRQKVLSSRRRPGLKEEKEQKTIIKNKIYKPARKYKSLAEYKKGILEGDGSALKKIKTEKWLIQSYHHPLTEKSNSFQFHGFVLNNVLSGSIVRDSTYLFDQKFRKVKKLLPGTRLRIFRSNQYFSEVFY